MFKTTCFTALQGCTHTPMEKRLMNADEGTGVLDAC